MSNAFGEFEVLVSETKELLVADLVALLRDIAEILIKEEGIDVQSTRKENLQCLSFLVLPFDPVESNHVKISLV